MTIIATKQILSSDVCTKISKFTSQNYSDSRSRLGDFVFASSMPICGEYKFIKHSRIVVFGGRLLI